MEERWKREKIGDINGENLKKVFNTILANWEEGNSKFAELGGKIITGYFVV